jgi:flagellar FliL protein
VKGIIKIVGFVVIGLLIGAGGLFAAVQFLGLPLGKPVAAEEAAAETTAATEKHEVPHEGVMVPLRERIVNLADPGILRYLKTTITLEVSDPNHGKGGGGDHAKPKKGEEMPLDLRPKGPMIEDYVTTLLTAKTTGELMTPQGKAALKQELKTVLNTALKEERVLAVYFTDFVIQ